MRVVVTGACGRLGRAVLGALREQGHDILGVDRQSDHGQRCPDRVADLADLGQVYGALAGAEAVIHLAAIPNPLGYTPDIVYRNNVLCQFNVFEAAANLGIRRVVSASSVSALGFPYQLRRSEPRYVPIDEAHPLLPQDAYGLSKASGEETAAAYCRRGAGSAASLRFSTILHEDAYERFIAQVRVDPGASAPLLWSYVDLRDATAACLLALTAPFEGHQPLYVTATDTTADLPTATLLDRYYSGVPRRRETDADAPGARWSLLDCARAHAVLGYRPRHTWQDVPAGRAGGAGEQG